MSRKQAQDVERDYYEFRRQMAEKRRAAQRSAASATQANIPQPRPQRTGFPDVESDAPAQAASSAPRPASRESAPVRPQPSLRVRQTLPAEPVGDIAAEAGVQPPVAEQSIPAPTPVQPEPEIETTDVPAAVETAAPLDTESIQAAFSEESDESDDYEDDEGDYEEDEDDYEEDEDGEESASSFGTLLKGMGAKFGALSDRLKALTHRNNNNEETADEEEDYDDGIDGNAASEESDELTEAPAESVDEALTDIADETPVDSADEALADIVDAPAVGNEPVEPSDDEDMVDVAATSDESAVQPRFIDDEIESDENGDADDEDDEDDDEPSVLNRLMSRVHGLFARRADNADTDEEYEEDSEADDENAVDNESVQTEPEDSSSEETPPADNESGDDLDLYDENTSDEDWDQFIEEDDDDDLSTPAAHNASDAQDMEGEQSTMDNNQKSMTELMAEGMRETPSLSRRERRMLNEAAGVKTPSKEAAPALNDDSAEVEEPTVEYKPVRTRPPKKAPVVLNDDEDDDDDEDDEEEVKKPVKAVKKKAKRPVYDDDDDEEEEDEDEDDEDIDDDDDDDDISVSKRIFGFIRALLAIVLVLALLVIALRVGEAGGYFKLDWLRDNLGSRVSFVNTLFPEPADSSTLTMPDVQ